MVGERREGMDGCGMVGKAGWLGKTGGGNGWLWNGRKGWLIGERVEWIVVE